MDEKIIKHESFAVLQISRVSGDSKNLFGSSIQHQHFIELRISPAYINRDLNKDWICSSNIPYITIAMSNSQFAEAITSLNMGEGTPVTLKSMITKEGYKNMQEPPREDKRMQFDNEFKEQMEKLSKNLESKTPEIEEIISKLPKKYQEQLRNKLSNLFQEIGSNIPFIKKQFTEQLDKTSLEAKGEIEGFFLNKIHSLGLEQLKLNNILKTDKSNNKLELEKQ